MVQKDYVPRKSLRDEGINKIVGEGISHDSIRITIQHDKGDKQPIAIEIAREWYGDIREKFRTDAEAYNFKPAVILDLDREIGMICLDMVDEIIAEIEKRSAEEIAIRQQQLRNRQIVAAGPPDERIEAESMAAEAIGDYRKQIPVRKAIYADPATIYTVFGQITATGKPVHKIKGGQYQCSHCHGIQYIQYERPSDVGDDEAPQIMHRMCRHCEEQNFAENSREYREATELHLSRPVPVNAVKIELMDTEVFDAVHTLPVWLFGKESEDVKVGEYVEIRGKHQSVPLTRSRRVFHGVLYAHDIKYTNRTVYILTDRDIDRVKKFVELAPLEKDPKTKQPKGERNIINRLVWMYGHHIIWNEEAKEALLYAETSAGPDRIGKGSSNQRRKRINVGLVGNPGLGKSAIARIILLHDDRNAYESAQGSSGKTMTAIVTREGGDNALPVLRTGVLAHTKEAVIAINEMGEVSLEEQKHFQDSEEEGQFSINKQGIRATIRADAVHIWTSNPKQGASFSNDKKISLDEIPIRKQLLDRADLLIIVRPIRDEQTRREFNDLMLDMEEALQDPVRNKIISNYDRYIKIHIMYAKRIKPVLSPEAKYILKESDVRIQSQKIKDDVANAGSNRGLGTLLRLATVIAKLKLHTTITAEDARYAVEYYNKVSADIQAATSVPGDIAEVALNTMLYILQNESNGLAMSLRTLAESASARDQAVKWYLFQGTKNKLGDVSTNGRLKHVLGLLENVSSSKIKRVKLQPAEFLWVGKNEVPEEESEETEHADVAYVADRGVSAVQGKISSSYDIDKPKTDSQPENGVSATSATSAITHKIPPEEKEYKVLKAMEIAMANYKDSKMQGKEAGSLFDPYDVWYHLFTVFPNEQWDIEKVHKEIAKQIEKGRVTTRAGDPPDRYYLMWRDGGEGGGGGANQ